MSAFQCAPEHLNAMLHFLRNPHPRYRPSTLRVYANSGERREFGSWFDDETWQQAFVCLWEQNARSVGARYRTDATPCPVDAFYSPAFVAPLKPVDVLKMCACYDYQACETDDYPQTLAHALVDLIRKDAIGRLPGYDEAPWELEDPRFVKKAAA